MSYTESSLTEVCEEIVGVVTGMNLPLMVNSAAIELFRCGTAKDIFPEISEAIDDLYVYGYFRFQENNL